MDAPAYAPNPRAARDALLAARLQLADLRRRAARAAVDPVTLVGELEAIGAALDRLDGCLMDPPGPPGRAGEDVVLDVRPARPVDGRAVPPWMGD